MMRFRKIDPRVWNDQKFRTLSDRAKLLFLFILTHPHMTMLGAMRATVLGLAAELRWTERICRQAFEEVLSKGLVEYDEEASFLGVPNFIKYNRPESPNVVISWGQALDLIPECPLKVTLIQRVKAFTEDFTEGFQKALPKVFAKTSPNQEQELEQEQERRHAQPALTRGHQSSGEANGFYQQGEELIEFLNEKTGKRFVARLVNSRPTKGLAMVVSLLKSGYSEKNVRQVIANRCAKWSRDEKMSEYLRPEHALSCFEI